jgi:hypothetical protein
MRKARDFLVIERAPPEQKRYGIIEINETKTIG